MGVYLHLPFCRERCAYCDFTILTRQEQRIDAYLEALEAEIARFSRERGCRRADSVYFGGGTPSRIPGEGIANLLDAVAAAFQLDEDTEISIEANPEDITAEKTHHWRTAGVNRVTLGIQSMQARGLARLGRPGHVEDVFPALERLRDAELPTIGADLIFGAPGQSPEQWHSELDACRELELDHLSCYALETTGRTPLVRAIERGDGPLCDPDLAAELFEQTRNRLLREGWQHYEISNFARPGSMSRHNLKYWSDTNYAGFGLAAASYVDGERWTNPRGYAAYLRAARGGQDRPKPEPYEPSRRAGEALVFGLRRLAGVRLERIAERYGVEQLRAREAAIARAIDRGLAVRDGDRLRLSEAGLLLADEFFAELI